MAIPSGITYGWPSTNASIPASHTRVTALDARYAKMVATSATNPGATGGANTHSHTGPAHSHTWGGHTHTSNINGYGTISTIRRQATPGVTASSQNHDHQPTLLNGAPGVGNAGAYCYSSASAEPLNLVVIFIQSDGTPNGIPANAIAFFNAAAPNGWTAYANGADNVWKGAAAAGDGGATGGTGTHSHTASGTHNHTYTVHNHQWATTATGATTAFGTPGCAVSAPGHAHTGNSAPCSCVSGTLGNTSDAGASGDQTPAYYKVLTVQNTSNAVSTPANIICVWTGTLATIPQSWKLCDGSSGTPNLANGKYVRGANGSGEVGVTAGSATHSHVPAAHTHTGGPGVHAHGNGAAAFGAASGATVSAAAPCCAGCPLATQTNHQHSWATCIIGNTNAGTSGCGTATASATANNDFVFTGVAYIQFQPVINAGFFSLFAV